MLSPVPTRQFTRDVRRAVKRGKDIGKLTAVINMLCADTPLPDRCRDHALSGNYSGFRDCHVEPDWILVYRVERVQLHLVLFRTGTHADLFDS